MGTPAVIFDLDGTLVDSEPAYYEAGRRLFAPYGVPGFTWEQHERFVGIGTADTLAALREEYGIDTPAAELLAVLDRHYLELAAAVEVFPRMGELVAALRDAGCPLAVASGSSPEAIGAVLSGTGLDASFGTVVSAQEVALGKPHPDVFVETARRLGVPAGDCVVVEDSPAGVRAAARAGMRCVAVPSVPRQAADPAFATAGLLFAGGQREFDPVAACAWIRGG